MRFISKSARYKTFPVHEKVEQLADGSSRQLSPGVIAEFGHNVPLEDWEIELARRTFHFTGTMQEEDEATPVDPIHRVSVYDTEHEQRTKGWDDNLREKVEQALLKNPNHGRDFVLAEEPMPAVPWNNYDEMSAVDQITSLVAELGLDPNEVIRYEKRSRNRADVIDALIALDVKPAEVVRG